MMPLARVMLLPLAVWALWFTAAYSLHGTQCSDAWAMGRGAGQLLQVGCWLLALAAIAVMEWRLRRFAPNAAPANATLLRGAAVARGLGVLATLFVGLPVLVLAPC